jgi:FkbM family methyltransferase
MRIRMMLARISCISWLRALYRTMVRVPGLSALLRATVQHAIPFGTRVWVRIHSGVGKGLWLKLDPRWHKAYLEGSYEPGIQNLLCEYLRPGDVLYDVGAHIGFFSIIAARLVGRGGKVFAFEAAPENVTALEQNVRKNELCQIEINPVAVWCKCGKLNFGRPYAGALAGAVFELGAQGSPPTSNLQIEVPATTLDRFLEKHQPPRLIKIDVEGAEAEVLEGAKRLFEQYRPVLICEVHHQRAAMSVQKWLAQTGYELQWLAGAQTFPRHLVAHPEYVAHAPSINVHIQIAS